MQEWQTADSGATWRKVRDLTAGSTDDNIHAQAPKNASPHLKVIWLAGTYNTYADYSLGIKGLIRRP
jgi:hypothetical protein